MLKSMNSGAILLGNPRSPVWQVIKPLSVSEFLICEMEISGDNNSIYLTGFWED